MLDLTLAVSLDTFLDSSRSPRPRTPRSLIRPGSSRIRRFSFGPALSRAPDSDVMGDSLPWFVLPSKAKATRATKAPKVEAKHPPIGIDLSVRGVEVKKLFYAAFARGLVKDGYDPEECLQEVYRGLLTRNKGKCPFDVRKSSFGHYVHIITRCVLANYIRKEKRRRMFESNEGSLLTPGSETGFSIESSPDLKSPGVDPSALASLSHSIGGGDERVTKALALLTQGYTRREVVKTLGVETKWLEGVLSRARASLTAE